MTHNPDAFAIPRADKGAWLRACQSAPYVSEAKPPFYEGDLAWPDSYPKDDTSRMLIYTNGEWLSLYAEYGKIFKVQK